MKKQPSEIYEQNKRQGRLLEKELYHKLKSKRQCERCKKNFDTPLEIHHKIPLSRGGTNKKGNLMVLCKECHIIVDNKVIWKPRK